ncbi:DNA cytosine methyltransferase [Enterococcus entomosocium]|uniref:DNA cytosine methyltransferase n=1 Tax=Enterococcus entomosocium TaxID=3034352 RepID=UPI0026484395|nr:DNA cytosine methyltransferase [Enterococcus entomosocium]
MLKVFEAFAGVGSQRMALRNLGIPHEIVAIAEIDKFAIASYEAIHGKVNNLGDISTVATEDIPDHDLFTYSFPCQDISVAGKQAGLDVDSGTRSGLLWECQKVIAAKKPKYLLLENVKNLVGKRHKANFDLWLEWLVAQGYSNYWQVLNAKDCGVPQNRERVFVVSILGEHVPFCFPKRQKITTRLLDLLEENVDEKFTLDNTKTRALLAQIDYVPTEEIKLNQVGNFEKLSNPNKKFNDPQIGRVLDTMGICQALDTMQGGNRQPKILIKNATKQGYLEAYEGDDIDLAYPNSSTRRGRVQKESSPTLQTGDTVGTLDSLRIRKLTPLECWRLMGFTDQDFYKAQAVNSNSQLYKQAGNAIVVPVLEGIFSQLFNVGERRLEEVA